MSKVAISGGATGSATYTIQAPTGSTDRVLTLPDEAGTVLTNSGYITADGTNLILKADGTNEDARIDSSGNLLFAKTTTDFGTDGIRFDPNGRIQATMDGNNPFALNRRTSDGVIADFRKDGSTVGSIGVDGGSLYFTSGGSPYIAGTGSKSIGLRMNSSSTVPSVFPVNNVNGVLDNQVDLGYASGRFDDIFATNALIQTSDRNEKQDIEELSEAEQRVAVSAKALMRKFRWKDKVAEKGDDARIHFGIIAQDLQAAFEAEGLDAGRYAMFISSTWWEAEETYTDDEGVEQIRINTYDTAEEAPEGATERTRLGVRYPELLAFIIGAL